MFRTIFVAALLIIIAAFIPVSIARPDAPTVMLVLAALTIAGVATRVRTTSSEKRDTPDAVDSTEGASAAGDPWEERTVTSAGVPASATASDQGTQPPRQSSSEPVVTDHLRREVEVRREIESRLLVAMEVAEAADNAKSEFLANISHELRTPMTAIIASAQLLKEYVDSGVDDDNHPKEILEIILSSSDSMMQLINDLLDFATTEAGRVKLDRREFSLRQTIAHTVRSFSVRYRQKGVDLVWDVDQPVPDLLVGDVNRIRQVLNNLLDNALKFTEEGSVVCRVHEDSATLGPDGDRLALHLSVRDTGVGIPVDKRELIFEAFKQVDGSSTRRFGGSGLGLAITRQLIEMMDGRIWVEGNEGEGSTFHVIIQVGLVQVPASPSV